MEIRRFGVGHRRPDGPPLTSGVAGQVIHSDGSGTIVELAFARRASMEAHSNPNLTWFVVIEGGGWVAVGDDVARVAAGEAVKWPPGVEHAAWTELSEMRAVVVELAVDDDPTGIVEGRGRQIGPGPGDTGETGWGTITATGELRRLSAEPVDTTTAEGEPL